MNTGGGRLLWGKERGTDNRIRLGLGGGEKERVFQNLRTYVDTVPWEVYTKRLFSNGERPSMIGSIVIPLLLHYVAPFLPPKKNPYSRKGLI